MANKKKFRPKTALAVNKCGVQPDKTITNDYVLNKQRSLENKLASCSKDHMTVTPADINNFVIVFSTADFELARQATISCLHPSTGVKESRAGRHLEHTEHHDGKGNIVTEVMSITNWNCVVKPTQVHHTGTCKIVIHLYRSQSSCLINGKDASNFMDIWIPALEASIAENSSTLYNANVCIGKETKSIVFVRKSGC